MEPKELYLKTVCKLLQGPRREKKRFLLGLQGDIESFFEQNPDASYTDMEANFGCPKDLAQEFANSLDPQVMERFLRIRRQFFLLIGIVAIATALVIVGLQVLDYIEWKHLADGYYVETIIVSPDSEVLPEYPEESTDTTEVYR